MSVLTDVLAPQKSSITYPLCVYVPVDMANRLMMV